YSPFFLSPPPRPPSSLLFPYTTLFRSSPMIERSPLCPPGPPPSRKRSLPNGRAKSSTTTSISVSGARSRASTLRTASPDSFIYRSEEHTSELQSRVDLVCRLLLEKKKQ